RVTGVLLKALQVSLSERLLATVPTRSQSVTRRPRSHRWTTLTEELSVTPSDKTGIPELLLRGATGRHFVANVSHHRSPSRASRTSSRQFTARCITSDRVSPYSF